MQNFNLIFKNDRYNHINDYSFIYFYYYNMKEMERRKENICKSMSALFAFFIFFTKLNNT